MTDPTHPVTTELAAGQPEIPAQTQEPDATDPPETGGPENTANKWAPTLNRRTITLTVAGAVSALLLAGTGVYTAFQRSPLLSPLVEQKSPLAAAKDTCGSSLANDAVLGDEGRTLTLHGDGEESSGLSFSTLECYWSQLKMPDSVKAEVLATRALDGRQSGDWDDIHASWSYHPDSGLQMVITVTD